MNKVQTIEFWFAYRVFFKCPTTTLWGNFLQKIFHCIAGFRENSIRFFFRGENWLKIHFEFRAKKIITHFIGNFVILWSLHPSCQQFLWHVSTETPAIIMSHGIFCGGKWSLTSSLIAVSNFTRNYRTAGIWTQTVHISLETQQKCFSLK